MEFRYLFTLIVYIVINMTEASNFEEPNCPRCSKFEYEEKTLEKLVRLQYQFEKLKEQWGSWEQGMNEKMVEFSKAEKERHHSHNTREQTINDKILELSKAEEQREDALKSLQEEQKIGYNTTLKNVHQQVSRMSQDLMDQQTEINRTVLAYKDELKTPTVLFKARGVTTTSPSGQMVTFGTIVSNIGGGYDSSTGYFTAPHSGTYMFTVQFCTYSSKVMRAHIIAADNVIGMTSHYESNAVGTCTSGDGVAVLTQGQKVWIKCSSASAVAIYQGTSNYWNTFSGILIHTGTE